MSKYPAMDRLRDQNTAKLALLRTSRRKVGGARRDRTDDILLAKQALSQLSYGPIICFDRPETGWPGWTRTTDLTLIRRAL